MRAGVLRHDPDRPPRGGPRMPGGHVGGGSVRRWIGALAAAVVLGMGPVACGGGGDGPTGKSAADPYPAQRDQLLAHLKGTSQGAHVTGVAISPQNSKTDMRIDIDTDF